MSLVFWKQIEIKHQICYCNNIIRVSRAKVEDCDDTWDGPISHFWASCSIGLEVCPVTALCCHLHHNLNWLQIKGQCILEEGLLLTYATLATNQRIKEVFKSLNVIYVGADHCLWSLHTPLYPPSIMRHSICKHCKRLLLASHLNGHTGNTS